jgi:hypothetical protein
MAPTLTPTIPVRLSMAQATNEDINAQDMLRAQVSFERLVFTALAADPTHVPHIDDTTEAFKMRGWAILSLGESLAKTIAAAVTFAVAYVADTFFKQNWSHEAYGEATAAHFASFWRSGLMIISPDAAFNSAFTQVQVDVLADTGKRVTVDGDKEVDDTDDATPVKTEPQYQLRIGRQEGGLEWGTVGNLNDDATVTMQVKLQLIGQIA